MEVPFFDRTIEMIPAGWTVALVSSLGVMASIIQTVPAPDPNVVDHIERLGVNGLLALAVIVLWRKVQEKDSILMQNYKEMSAALASNKVLVEKMSDTLDEIRGAMEKIGTVRSVLHSEGKGD